jgi:hypothetical protein
MTTATDIVNEALQLVGDNLAPVTGALPNFDTSAAGVAAKYLYTPTVQAVGRRFGWDFSRNVATLAVTTNVPPWPWTYEYIYPASGIQIRQLMPPTPLVDPNNPLPVNSEIGNTLVGGTPTKVIWCDIQNAKARITNTPNENLWDPLFRDAVVRLLGSALATATAGRPETARDLIDTYAQVEALGEARDS